MIGHNKIGLSRPADAVFYKAGLIMWAGGMDALAASIGHAIERAMPEKFSKPAWQIATHQVAIPARLCPTCQEGQRQQCCCTVISTGGGGIEKILHVQEAQIVFPAFADDHLLSKSGFVRIKAVEFLFDLPLKMARIGADPDGTVILFGPEAGWGDVTQCLASPGSGFR
ncbi:hypothetical protein AA100600_2342 [Gluconobacter thailandicus F149-1 = NBRC 100600]|nr:hypothetical protein AA100600_2342 [Gluconobacter thailandicus F149-1 = NBRC 100600]